MHCNFKLTEPEVVKAMQLHSRGSRSTLVFMISAGVALIFVGIFTEFKTLGFGSAIGGLLGFLITQSFFVPLKAKNQYQQHRALRSEMSVSLSEDEIDLVIETGNSKLRWADIHQWKFGKDIYLLYVTSNMFYIIPSRAVLDEGVLVGLLSKHVGRRKL